MVYYAAKASANIANVGRKQLSIHPITIHRLKVFFPMLDLLKVRIINQTTLPANWIERRKKTEAMTCGLKIYAKRNDLQFNYVGILILIRELLHVHQMQRLGELNFAAR
jgi:hypothetical protein